MIQIPDSLHCLLWKKSTLKLQLIHIKLLHTHLENTDAFNPREIEGPPTYTREHLGRVIIIIMMIMGKVCVLP